MKTTPFLLAALVAAPVLLAQTERPPNLVVIMADDLGYADVGFQGNRQFPTPHIDTIAAQGVKFTDGYVTFAVCSPSRAGFITGRYPQRFGYERNVPYRPNNVTSGLAQEEQTIADHLRTRGYTSGIVGKWHLGSHPDLHPLRRGFDFFFGHLGGGHRYFPEELTIRNSRAARNEADSYRTWILRNEEPVQTTQYLTDEFTNAAVEFIETSHAQPFFLFLSYNAPHAPLQATPELLARAAHIPDEKRRTYAAMVMGMDDGVGKVLAALTQHGLDENTIVVFLSDNGGPTQNNGSRNAPLRGGKSDPWEGGWRVPFAMRWTGTLPAGAVYQFPITSMDITASIVALSGATPAAERPLDGVNLIPYLTGAQRGRPNTTIFLRQFDRGAWAIRHVDYKLVMPRRDQEPVLFNLRQDVREANNIARDNPQIVTELERRWLDWNAQLEEPRFEGLSPTEWGGKAPAAGKQQPPPGARP